MENYHCLACGTSLRGAPIPLDQQQYFGGATHWERVIGMYDLKQDRVMKWACPDCGYEWKRGKK